MKPIVRIFLILLFPGFMARGLAQAGLQLSYMDPVGTAAYSLKRGMGAEFMYSANEIDSRWKFSGYLGFFSYKTTQDTFPLQGMLYGQTTALLPGYEVISKYQSMSCGFGAVYKLLNKKLSPIIGMDGYLTFVSMSYHRYVETLIDETFSNEMQWQFAIFPKAGVSYQMNDNWLLNAGIGRNMGFGSTGSQAFWKSYISLQYYLN